MKIPDWDPHDGQLAVQQAHHHKVYVLPNVCFPTLSAEQYSVRVAFPRTSLRILRTANLGQDVYVKEAQSEIGSNGTMTRCRVLRQIPLGL